jgi:hypothetical protein
MIQTERDFQHPAGLCSLLCQQQRINSCAVIPTSATAAGFREQFLSPSSLTHHSVSLCGIYVFASLCKRQPTIIYSMYGR